MKMLQITNREIVGVDLRGLINSMYNYGIYRKVGQKINLWCDSELKDICWDHFGSLTSHLETDLFVNSSRFQEDPRMIWKG